MHRQCAIALTVSWAQHAQKNLDIDVLVGHIAPMLTLAEWMSANGFDDDRLAAALEIDRSTASRFRRGKLLPSSTRIAKIAALTKGAVQPNTFFGLSAASPPPITKRERATPSEAA